MTNGRPDLLFDEIVDDARITAWHAYARVADEDQCSVPVIKIEGQIEDQRVCQSFTREDAEQFMRNVKGLHTIKDFCRWHGKHFAEMIKNMLFLRKNPQRIVKYEDVVRSGEEEPQ